MVRNLKQAYSIFAIMQPQKTRITHDRRGSDFVPHFGDR